MISHVEQRSSRRESRGWFFFLARVVPRIETFARCPRVVPSAAPRALRSGNALRFLCSVEPRTQLLILTCAHYVMVSKFRWKPFWLATHLDPQNDWTGWQYRANCDFSHRPHYNLVASYATFVAINCQW